MAEKKVYSVKGKNFILPDEVAYNQYYNINKILEDAKISVNDLADIKERGSKIKMSFGIGKVLNAILAQNKIPEFLATLLIPEGAECWEPEMVAENKDILMYMGDKSIMEMVQGFFIWKGGFDYRNNTIFSELYDREQSVYREYQKRQDKDRFDYFEPRIGLGEDDIPAYLTEGNLTKYDKVLTTKVSRVYSAYYYAKVKVLNKLISDLNALVRLDKK